MEDVHCAVLPSDSNDVNPSHSLDPYSFFGVFDGHGGKRAAEYVEQNLYPDLMLVLQKEKDPEEALHAAFEQTESRLCMVAKENEWMDGTTAAVALVDPIRHQCIIGNVGDSEIVHGYRNACGEVFHQVLTEKHTMKNEAEIERVITAGGRVWRDRMAHPNFRPEFLSLAVSRSLGDVFFKDSEYTEGKESGLIAKPSISVLDIRNLLQSKSNASGSSLEKQMLILASDGLWDKMTYADVVELSLEKLEQGMDPQAVSNVLVQQAAAAGSRDNITVVLVTL
jgi:serine/threonine protein phosphatase PrpC